MRVDASGKATRLVVDGFECSTWDEVSIDSAIDTPADAWNLTLFNPAMGHLPFAIKAGASAQIYYGDELILTGVIDHLKEAIGRNGRVVNISGRDLIGQLIDCSVPIFNGKQLTLQELVNRFVKGGDLSALFKRVIIQNQAWLKNKVSVEPGESIYDALVKAAQVTGQFLWMQADGTLEIGDPFASSYVVKIPLQLMFSGDDNNVIAADYGENVSRVFSDIQILSQDRDAKKILAQGTSKTPYAYKRLKLVSAGDVETQAEAQALLNKAVKDNDLEAYSLNCDVAGWLVDGKVWQAGWTVSLQSDVLVRANAKWIVMGRTLTLSRSKGKTTRLKLKRQGDWAQPLLYKEKSKAIKKSKSKNKDAGDD